MAVSTMALDQAKCYLSLHEREDGTFSLVDQDGRELAGVRVIRPTLAYDDVATCEVDFILAKAGTVAKYVNRKDLK